MERAVMRRDGGARSSTASVRPTTGVDFRVVPAHHRLGFEEVDRLVTFRKLPVDWS